MQMIILTAFGIGGATIFGAAIGFCVKNVSHKVNDMILSFAAGVMLAAAVNGLITPSFELVSGTRRLLPIAGIFAGALFLNFMDKVTPHLHMLAGAGKEEEHVYNKNLNRALLFVMAIAIHNLPEGMAAGVSFGNDDVSAAITVAIGIGLQNIPESIVTIAPLVTAGVSRKRAFVLAAATGFIEVIGTLLGFFVASASAAVLPFALSFAGGTMLYIISDEMIPETHSHGYERISTYLLLAGFSLMLLLDMIL